MGKDAKTSPNVHETDGSIYNVNHPDDPKLAQDMQVKAALVMQIEQIREKRGLTQVQLAKILKITQPDVSDILRGRFRKYSVDKIMDFLNLLDRDITIVVTPHPVTGERGVKSVSIA